MRIHDVIRIGGKGGIRGKRIDPMTIGVIKRVGNHGGRLIGDCVADAGGGACGLVEQVAGRRVR
jgi:hypothetical protein